MPADNEQKKAKKREYNKEYYQRNKALYAAYHRDYRKRKALEAGKQYRPRGWHCDRNCGSCCHPDCIEENMTLEEFHASNARDKSINEERRRQGNAPMPATEQEREINRVEYNRALSRAKHASRLAEAARQRGGNA